MFMIAIHYMGIFLASLFGLSSLCRAISSNRVAGLNMIAFAVGMVMVFIR